jgi:hypothetical protein
MVMLLLVNTGVQYPEEARTLQNIKGIFKLSRFSRSSARQYFELTYIIKGPFFELTFLKEPGFKAECPRKAHIFELTLFS